MDRDEDVPELFNGVQVPQRLRHDREGAFAWLQAAIQAAAAADEENSTEAEEEADDEN